jgi:hypothetical protein
MNSWIIVSSVSLCLYLPGLIEVILLGKFWKRCIQHSSQDRKAED